MRWLIRLAVLLLVLVGLSLGALMLVPSDRIARIAERRFEDATGRSMTLGTVSATIYPQLGIRIADVSVANADWAADTPMLTAASARIGVDLWALMTGAVRIEEVEISRPVLQLVADEEGRTNWDFEVSSGGAEVGASSASGALPAFSIDRGIVSDGRITYVNLATGKDTILDAFDMVLRLPAFDGPADVELSALLHDRPQNLKARIDRFDVFATGDVSGLSLSVDVSDNSLELEGRGGYAPMAFDGQLEAKFSDIPALFDAMGADRPDIPEGLGKDRVEIAGTVTLTPEKTLHLRGGRINADDNALAGEFDADLNGNRPRFNAKLQGEDLDFSALAAGSDADGQSEGTAVGDAGWSKNPINADFLSLMDGSIAFTARSVNLGTLKLGTTDTLTTIENARAAFGLRSISAYDGTISGEFVMNNRNGLSVGGDLNLANLAMQPLLRDLADYERLIGTGNVDLKFLGVGNSLDAIMKSLSGGGSLNLGAGELRGLDLAGMLRNLDRSYEGSGSKTIFDSIAATFTINNGVLSNNDLAFRAPLASATGEGTVDIGNKQLNYRVVPTALAAEDGTGGITVPVIITGPWSDPSFRPDLEFLLKQELEDERKAAEEQLKQQAEEALGVQRQEDESLEDAVKRGLEEELGKKVLDLFGSN